MRKPGFAGLFCFNAIDLDVALFVSEDDHTHFRPFSAWYVSFAHGEFPQTFFQVVLCGLLT